VTTKHGTSPSGPASLQPPSPSFFLKDVRPMTTAPVASTICCRTARSWSVAAPENQSCSCPAPSPNGFSRLSFGPVTYPFNEMDMSQITRPITTPPGRATSRPSVLLTGDDGQLLCSSPTSSRPSGRGPPGKQDPGGVALWCRPVRLRVTVMCQFAQSDTPACALDLGEADDSSRQSTDAARRDRPVTSRYSRSRYGKVHQSAVQKPSREHHKNLVRRGRLRAQTARSCDSPADDRYLLQYQGRARR